MASPASMAQEEAGVADDEQRQSQTAAVAGTATTVAGTATAGVDTTTAVAGAPVAVLNLERGVITMRAPDHAGFQSDQSSVGGDTVCTDADSGASDSAVAGASESAVAASTRHRHRAPKELVQGVPEPCRPSKFNSEPEVGNFGLFFGNWGTRGTNAGKPAQKKRRDNQDKQILKSPAQVVIIAEASAELEELLTETAVAGNPEKEGVASRTSC